MEAIVTAIISTVGSIIAAIIAARASQYQRARPVATQGQAEASPPADAEAVSPDSEQVQAPAIWKVLISLLVPGLGSLLIRGWRTRGVSFLLLVLTIPVSFVVFGPLWGEVLFARSDYSQIGFWPFLATCVVVPIISVALAYNDRERVGNMA